MSDVIPFPAPETVKTLEQDGKTVDARVYNNGEGGWILEIVDHFGNSTMFDDPYASAKEALDIAQLAVEQEGIDEFIGNKSSIDLDSHFSPFKVINRTALIIGYKQPAVDWINQVDSRHPITLEEINRDPHVYLADEHEGDLDLIDPIITLQALFDEIFERELAGWYIDPECWPENRDWKTFTQWFSFSFQDMVHDMGGIPLISEEL